MPIPVSVRILNTRDVEVRKSQPCYFSYKKTNKMHSCTSVNVGAVVHGARRRHQIISGAVVTGGYEPPDICVRELN